MLSKEASKARNKYSDISFVEGQKEALSRRAACSLRSLTDALNDLPISLRICLRTSNMFSLLEQTRCVLH